MAASEGGGAAVVLTGRSGAGKQLAARVFEDMGRRVVDNLPPRLLPDLLQTPSSPNDDFRPLCVVCDVRAGRAGVADLLPSLDRVRANGAAPPVTLLFLDASDAALVQRFKETRRTHPLFHQAGGIVPALAAETDLLALVKERADKIMDTSGRHPSDLRAELMDLFADPVTQRHPLTVTVASFGFKHGSPTDADLVFDVRFLRNPHYVNELRPFDGRDDAIENFVMADERTGCFLDRLYDLVGWSLPHYVSEGKAYLTIGIGCTGGRHRSVVVAEKLAQFVRERGYRVLVQHRDLGHAAAGRAAFAPPGGEG